MGYIFPDVTVYVNQSTIPSLVVKQISTRKKGKIGFWVGHNSEGCFKNLKIWCGEGLMKGPEGVWVRSEES